MFKTAALAKLFVFMLPDSRQKTALGACVPLSTEGRDYACINELLLEKSIVTHRTPRFMVTCQGSIVCSYYIILSFRLQVKYSKYKFLHTEDINWKQKQNKECKIVIFSKFYNYLTKNGESEDRKRMNFLRHQASDKKEFPVKYPLACLRNLR